VLFAGAAQVSASEKAIATVRLLFMPLPSKQNSLNFQHRPGHGIDGYSGLCIVSRHSHE
jgi:hypothetical protein